METLTINLDDEIIRSAKESAAREHKSLAEWIEERIKLDVKRASPLATLEAHARANGYPSGWLALYGSLADETTFTAPDRSSTRLVETINSK